MKMRLVVLNNRQEVSYDSNAKRWRNPHNFFRGDRPHIALIFYRGCKMQRGFRRLLKLSLLLASASTQVIAQTPAAPGAPAPPRNLSEFEGLYEYRDGGTLSMVASGERLVAIIGEGKYPLRAAGVDLMSGHIL